MQVLLMIFAVAAAQSVYGQIIQRPSQNNPYPDDGNVERGRSVRDMLARQKIEQARKEHEEILKRGNEALELAENLEKTISANGGVSKDDRDKVEELEKLVSKIRKELGGDSDGHEEVAEDEKPPTDVREAVIVLKDKTLRLVEELQKTSRFTISAAAIYTSNSVIRLTRFLRFRK